MRRLIKIIFICLSGCGVNQFAQFEKKNVALQATKYLEREQPDKAIELITNSLGSAYASIFASAASITNVSTLETSLTTELNNLVAQGRSDAPNLVSILASAQAQLYGADPFSIALTLATGGGESESSSSSTSSDSSSSAGGIDTLTTLFPVLPESTTGNIHGLEIAIALLNSLGSHQTSADLYKKAIFLTANIALITKGLTDSSGKISRLAVINMSTTTAANLLLLIASATLTAGAAQQNNGNAGSSTKAISNIQTKIDEQEGDDQNTKLRNYLVSKTSGS